MVCPLIFLLNFSRRSKIHSMIAVCFLCLSETAILKEDYGNGIDGSHTIFVGFRKNKEKKKRLYESLLLSVCV